MELLIPGLILVALMVWASTRIKKRAAEAFDAERIETDSYSIEKPEGFLHVVADEEHEFSAYSRDFRKDENAAIRQATIELDVFPGDSIANVRDRTARSARNSVMRTDAQNICELETEELVNEIAVKAFYKIVSSENTVYRLRFAVLPEHIDDYLRRIETTLDSFTVSA
jgi:hypothetical protein